MFVIQLLLGSFMIGLTVAMHAVALDYIIRNVYRLEEFTLDRAHVLWKALILACIVLAVFTAHIAEIWVWAGLYLAVDALPDLETALYFSTSTFTTVGYGDVVLEHNWRLIGSFEAANGFILFGWSAAFIYGVISRLYEKEQKKIKSG